MGAFDGRHVLVIGLGYSARAFAARVIAAGARVSGTSRSPMDGVTMVALDTLPRDITDLVVSAPPGEDGCPGLAACEAQGLRPGWIAYLSSTAVYGDCDGAWIDEDHPPGPRGADARARLVAEDGWRDFATETGAALDILRVAGIYGPGRDVRARLQSGQARAIIKPGQVFNRIHRDDIAGALIAAMAHPEGQRLINLADGAPCPASEILIGVADMMGLPRPEEVPLAEAGLPPAAAGFYAENRRLRNDRLLALPGFTLAYPTWRSAYESMLSKDN